MALCRASDVCLPLRMIVCPARFGGDGRKRKGAGNKQGRHGPNRPSPHDICFVVEGLLPFTAPFPAHRGRPRRSSLPFAQSSRRMMPCPTQRLRPPGPLPNRTCFACGLIRVETPPRSQPIEEGTKGYPEKAAPPSLAFEKGKGASGAPSFPALRQGPPPLCRVPRGWRYAAGKPVRICRT